MGVIENKGEISWESLETKKKKGWDFMGVIGNHILIFPSPHQQQSLLEFLDPQWLEREKELYIESV